MVILPYVIITIIIFSIIYGKYKNGRVFLYADDTILDKKILFIFFIFFYVLFAFRSQDVGNDTKAYIEVFNMIKNFTWPKMREGHGRYEIGFLYYIKLLSCISIHHQILFIVSGILIIISSYKLIVNYSNFILLSVFLFFTMRIFDDSMNILRQYLAISCIIYSYKYLRKKRIFLFVLWVLVASLFHKSAIVFLLAWFANNVKITKTIIFIWVISLFLGLVIPQYIIPLLFNYGILPGYYKSSEYFSEGKIAPFLMLLISMLICLFALLYKSYRYPNKKDGIFDNKNMLIFQMLATTFFVFNLQFAILIRCAAYFHSFSIILLPNTLKCIKNKGSFKFLFGIILLFFILYFIIIVTYRSDWNRVYPYSFTDWHIV